MKNKETFSKEDVEAIKRLHQEIVITFDELNQELDSIIAILTEFRNATSNAEEKLHKTIVEKKEVEEKN